MKKLRNRLLVTILLAFIFVGWFSFPGFAFFSAHNVRYTSQFSSGVSDFIPGEVLVGMTYGKHAQALEVIDGVLSVETSPGLEKLGAAIISVEEGREMEMVTSLASQKDIQFAELNYIVSTALIPNDTLWASQYGPQRVRAPEAWDVTTGSNDVVLAVVDSGIDLDHPEFADRLLNGYDFVDDDSTPLDECGHGTHVAGIAAATGNNNEGVAGINWGTRILPVRVLNRFCSGSVADVADALVWSVEHGADVINLSLGTSAASTLLENGTYYAYDHGATIIASSGNGGFSPVFYPAAYSWVLAVGATDQIDARASFSNYGTALDVMAPGVDVLSTTPRYPFYYELVYGTTQEYGTLGGTSMSAPHVSGAAAMMAALPAFDTPDKIFQALTDTALDLDTPGWDQFTGYGLLQIDAALGYVPSLLPTPTPVPPTVLYDIVDSVTCPNLVQYEWIDPSGGTWLPVFGNDGFATIGLPFPVDYAGTTYSDVTVSANGYITFGGYGGEPDNFLLPGIAEPNNLLAPFWDDLNPSAAGRILSLVDGNPSTRRQVIAWENVPRAGKTGGLNFEIIFFEENDDIQFQYQKLSGQGAFGGSTTVGIEFDDGHDGVLYAYNAAQSLENRYALRFVAYAPSDPRPLDQCVPPYSQVRNSIDFMAGVDGGTFWNGNFCSDLGSDALFLPSHIQIRLLRWIGSLPKDYINLKRFAEVKVLPVPGEPLRPAATLCYRYTASDLLAAGGHAENLFFARYDPRLDEWTRLQSVVDESQGLITANATGLSQFGVFARKPTALPETGVPFAWDTAFCLPTIAFVVFLMSGVWFFVRKARQFREN